MFPYVGQPNNTSDWLLHVTILDPVDFTNSYTFNPYPTHLFLVIHCPFKQVPLLIEGCSQVSECAAVLSSWVPPQTEAEHCVVCVRLAVLQICYLCVTSSDKNVSEHACRCIELLTDNYCGATGMHASHACSSVALLLLTSDYVETCTIELGVWNISTWLRPRPNTEQLIVQSTYLLQWLAHWRSNRFVLWSETC